MKIVEYITLEYKRIKLSKFLIFYFVFLIYPSPISNVATANAVKTAGAVPVFADINESDWCISVEDVKRKITLKKLLN